MFHERLGLGRRASVEEAVISRDVAEMGSSLPLNVLLVALVSHSADALLASAEPVYHMW